MLHTVTSSKIVLFKCGRHVINYICWDIRSDNKVRELATVCLLCQQWTEISVWFYDVGVSVFLSCVVVDLWYSLFECVLVCCYKNVGAWIRATNIKFLVKLGKSGSEIRVILVKVYGDNAVKKTPVYSGRHIFLWEETVSLMKRDQDLQIWRKHC
jgi:hypothetical protein